MSWHGGIRWPQIPRTERTQADAGVCAFLGTMDQGFNAETELETFEDNARVTQWWIEPRGRDAMDWSELGLEKRLPITMGFTSIYETAQRVPPTRHRAIRHRLAFQLERDVRSAYSGNEHFDF